MGDDGFYNTNAYETTPVAFTKKKQQCCSGDSAHATCLLGFWEMGRPRWVVTSCRTNRIPSSGSSKSYKVTHYIVWFQKKCQYCKVNQTIERKRWDYNSQISNTSLISAGKRLMDTRLFPLLTCKGVKSYKKKGKKKKKEDFRILQGGPGTKLRSSHCNRAGIFPPSNDCPHH